MKYFVERIIVIPVKDGEVFERQHYAAKFLPNNQYKLTDIVSASFFNYLTTTLHVYENYLMHREF